MNRIVREHYPAAKLPDDLREGIDPKARDDHDYGRDGSRA